MTRLTKKKLKQQTTYMLPVLNLKKKHKSTFVDYIVTKKLFNYLHTSN